MIMMCTTTMLLALKFSSFHIFEPHVSERKCLEWSLMGDNSKMKAEILKWVKQLYWQPYNYSKDLTEQIHRRKPYWKKNESVLGLNGGL